jgi:hypothetical protein
LLVEVAGVEAVSFCLPLGEEIGDLEAHCRAPKRGAVAI